MPEVNPYVKHQYGKTKRKRYDVRSSDFIYYCCHFNDYKNAWEENTIKRSPIGKLY